MAVERFSLEYTYQFLLHSSGLGELDTVIAVSDTLGPVSSGKTHSFLNSQDRQSSSSEHSATASNNASKRCLRYDPLLMTNTYDVSICFVT